MRPSLPHPHSLSSLYMVTNKSNVRMDSKSILFERHILLSDPKKTRDHLTLAFTSSNKSDQTSLALKRN